MLFGPNPSQVSSACVAVPVQYPGGAGKWGGTGPFGAGGWHTSSRKVRSSLEAQPFCEREDRPADLPRLLSPRECWVCIRVSSERSGLAQPCA